MLELREKIIMTNLTPGMMMNGGGRGTNCYPTIHIEWGEGIPGDRTKLTAGLREGTSASIPDKLLGLGHPSLS